MKGNPNPFLGGAVQLLVSLSAREEDLFLLQAPREASCVRQACSRICQLQVVRNKASETQIRVPSSCEPVSSVCGGAALPAHQASQMGHF